MTFDERLANARLIAAAPELLDQCKIFHAVLAWGSVQAALGIDHAKILHRLEAVIANAKAETIK